MLSLFRKNLLFLPSCCSSSSSQVHSFRIRFPVINFSSSSPLPPLPPLPPPPPPPPPPEPPRVSVWWDVDNCGVPSGVNYWNVAPSIMAAVRANGIKGEIRIRAYHQFSTKVSELDRSALWATGMDLHAVSGGKNEVYKALLQDLRAWVTLHPPPEHHFLISDDKHDRDFSGILHRLRMNNYNILVACPGRGSDILRSATTIMWGWPSMLKREDLTGKHFNYPPDGPFDSWYGDSKVPLENPFSVEEPTFSQNVSSVDDDSESFKSNLSQGKPTGEYVDGKSSFPLFKESNVHQPPNELEKTSLGSEKVVDVANALLPQVQLPPNDIDISKNSDNDNVRSEEGVCLEILEKKTTSHNPSTCNDYTVLENSDIAKCESGKAKAEKKWVGGKPLTSISF